MKSMKGESFIFLEALFWSLFPVITVLSFRSINPMYSAAMSTFFAALFFAVILTIQKKWHELKKKEAWKDILIVSVFIGILFYSLSFISLRYTSAGNYGLIGLLEVFFSFLILGILKKEKINFIKIAGAVLMVFGASFVLLPKATGIDIGVYILLSAQIFIPFGNLAQQNARKIVSSSTIMFLRSVISSAVIFILALIFFPFPSLSELNSSILFLIINGFLFMGFSKLLWIEGIHRIPITRANSINTLIPFLTLFFAYLILGEIPHFSQLIGIVPLAIGALILLRKDKIIETA